MTRVCCRLAHDNTAGCSTRLDTLIRQTAAHGEALDGPEVTREMVLVLQRGGFLVPAVVSIKVHVHGHPTADALEAH